jgi:ATP-dependent Clp protease ATP-binding subunit ClpB
VGYEEGGQLTEAVRRRPYAVLLFDEIEKAHADVFNLLLQILDDGRLTDGHGRTVDFRNTIIIMTSNLGSHFIQELADEGQIRDRIWETLRTHFRPEFLNRIDEVIIFHRLGMPEIKRIVEIQLRQLRRRLGERKIDITLSEGAREYLAEVGFDPVYGARPLKRALQRLILDPLATRILEGQFGEGDHVLIDVKNGQVAFSKASAPSS